MAVDPMSRRQYGVSQLTSADLAGSKGKDGDGVDLPTATYRNPGPTENMRGIEANTAWGDGSDTAPMIQTVTAGEAPPRGEVFHAQYAPGITAGPNETKWNTYDSFAKNSHVQPPTRDSFTAVGESYPANGGMDGES